MDARELIQREYEKRTNTGIYAEVNNPDSPHYGEDPEAVRASWSSGAKEENPAANMAAARRRLAGSSKQSPKPVEDIDDGRPVVFRAMDKFIEANPEYAKESAFNELANTALKSMHGDIYTLRERFNKTDSLADGEALLARSAEIAPGEKLERERREVFEQMAKDRFPLKG